MKYLQQAVLDLVTTDKILKAKYTEYLKKNKCNVRLSVIMLWNNVIRNNGYYEYNYKALLREKYPQPQPTTTLEKEIITMIEKHGWRAFREHLISVFSNRLYAAIWSGKPFLKHEAIRDKVQKLPINIE